MSAAHPAFPESEDGTLSVQDKAYPAEHNRKIELDVFHGYLDGLVLAEVEFESEEEAASYVLPDWFLEDVTFDRRYSNAVMARYNTLEELLLSSRED